MRPLYRIGISLGAGLLLAFVSWLYLHSERKRIQSHYKMTTVLFAKRYIPMGAVIKKEWVELRPLPEAYAQPTAMSSMENPLRARVGFLKGEQLTRSKTFDEQTGQELAWFLPAGKVGFSVELSLSDAGGGWVKAGDWVNVLGTFEKRAGLKTDTSIQILGHIQVMAVDGQLWDPVSGGIQKIDRKDVAKTSTIITLALSPKETVLLNFSLAKGRIRLALASAFEKEMFPQLKMGLKELSQFLETHGSL